MSHKIKIKEFPNKIKEFSSNRNIKIKEFAQYSKIKEFPNKIKEFSNHNKIKEFSLIGMSHKIKEK